MLIMVFAYTIYSGDSTLLTQYVSERNMRITLEVDVRALPL